MSRTVCLWRIRIRYSYKWKVAIHPSAFDMADSCSEFCYNVTTLSQNLN